jgi:superfamily II DNA/RNA helicase
MKIEELREWILSVNGLGSEIALLSRLAAAHSVCAHDLSLDTELSEFVPDWRRLLFAASVLAQSVETKAVDAALAIAHAGLLVSGLRPVADASAVLLGQRANHRAVNLAEARHLLDDGLAKRIGVAEQILSARRELEQTLFLSSGETVVTNQFQLQLWAKLENAAWVSASAPTASGKTFLVLQWLLSEFARRRAKLAVFIAPTRALVSEIEHELIQLATSHLITGLRIASLPLAELADLERPTILVFTQERLHVFLNSLNVVPSIDVAIVDEAHKLGDGLRGVILQDAIERVARTNADIKLVFLSPLTENPETLVSDAPRDVQTAVVPSDRPTVTQNLIVAEQKPLNSKIWKLSLQKDGQSSSLGEVNLHARPDAQRKRLSYVALALGRGQPGTLIYANGAHEAEQLAWQIFDGLAGEDVLNQPLSDDLQELSDFARDTIHPQFQLVDLLKRGVAFHYGNMPSLLRAEIERLFKKGSIRFLVCTSTLIEGVNLACRTIVVRGPRKGNKKPMGAHDFWNLAGRAGRWGQDFHGNIVCIDLRRPKLWPEGAPLRAKYPIRRETDSVLAFHAEMLSYLDRRSGLQTSELNPQLEQVMAYLLAWQVRDGSFLSSPSAARLPPDYAVSLDSRLTLLTNQLSIPAQIILRHSGISAVALQSLLSYFRRRRGPVEELIPAPPESDDACRQLIAAFKRINANLYQAFMPNAAIPVHALTTVEWMRGLPLGQMIRNRIAYLKRKERAVRLPTVIRETMRDVEEVARFRAPKYLSAYLDVLKLHLEEIGRPDLFPADLKLDLYLEFGVATRTLLSLIGLGLSRTSAVSINDYLAADDLTEDQVLDRILSRRWESLDVPAVVKHEVRRVIQRRRSDAAA